MTVSSRKAVVAFLLAAVMSVGAIAFANTTAYADEEMAALNAKVEETAQQYNAAVAAAEDINARILENQARINELQVQIEGQKEVSSDAVKSLYIYQRSSASIVNLVFSSDDVADLFGTLDYLNRYEQKNLEIIQTRIDLKNELTETQAQLEADKVAADEARAQAEQSLKDAQAAREEAMQRALAEAQAQLEAERQAREAREAAAAAAAANPAPADAGQAEQPAPAEEAPAVEETVSADDVSWEMPREDFINGWAVRIDNYLAGSPLEGYGRNFAEAAWNYGVDPRWSPAISNTESSKGAICFLPFNAWGWGSSSWSNWPEAIDAHVAGLSRGYGFTITLDAAMKYCPPTYQDWYNATLEQMQMI